MSKLSNAEMRSRLMQITGAYLRLTERQGMSPTNVPVAKLCKWYGFHNFTRVEVLHEALRKVTTKRKDHRMYCGQSLSVEKTMAIVFEALHVKH